MTTITHAPASREATMPAVALAAEASPLPVATAVVAADDEAGLARAFVIGSLVGAAAVFVLLGGLVLAAGLGLSAAIGTGLFTAFWGGPGFGGMMGAVLHYNRTQAH